MRRIPTFKTCDIVGTVFVLVPHMPTTNRGVSGAFLHFFGEANEESALERIRDRHLTSLREGHQNSAPREINSKRTGEVIKCVAAYRPRRRAQRKPPSLGTRRCVDFSAAVLCACFLAVHLSPRLDLKSNRPQTSSSQRLLFVATRCPAQCRQRSTSCTKQQRRRQQ